MLYISVRGIPYDLEVCAKEMVSSSSGRLLQERRYMQRTT